jgi:predicted GIY-YIG superfamily endonuclease
VWNLYEIVCRDLNIKDLYVGHTTDFRRRKNGHKSRSSSSEIKIYKTIRNNGGWDNWSMIEIEKFSCNDSNEATARERYWFEILQAQLNTLFPQRTREEYNTANKEKMKEINIKNHMLTWILNIKKQCKI